MYSSYYPPVDTVEYPGGGFLAIYFAVLLLAAVVELVGTWKVYDKLGGGLKGWHCIIPFYGFYALAKRCWSRKAAGWILACSILAVLSIFLLFIPLIPIIVAAETGDMTDSTLGSMMSMMMLIYIVMIILGTVLGVMEIITYVKMVEQFDCSQAYVIGVILLPVVFMAILGFSKNIHVISGGSEASA